MLHCDELGRVARALVLVFAVAFRHPSIDTTSSDAAAEASNVFAADASRVVAASLELPSEEEVPTVWGTLSVEDDAGSEAFDAAAAAAAVLLARESSSVLAERVETITLGCSVLEVRPTCVHVAKYVTLYAITERSKYFQRLGRQSLAKLFHGRAEIRLETSKIR